MSSTEKLASQSVLIDALEGLLSSRIGVVEASRTISGACYALGQDKNPLFVPFIGINSETDQFPLASVRELWAPEALVRYDQERALAEQRYSSLAIGSAAALLGWACSQEF